VELLCTSAPLFGDQCEADPLAGSFDLKIFHATVLVAGGHIYSALIVFLLDDETLPLCIYLMLLVEPQCGPLDCFCSSYFISYFTTTY